MWVFKENDGVWSQQGDKLVGSGLSGQANYGGSVAVNGNGTVLWFSGATQKESQPTMFAFALSDGEWVLQGSATVSGITVPPKRYPGATSLAMNIDATRGLLGFADASNVVGRMVAIKCA